MDELTLLADADARGRRDTEATGAKKLQRKCIRRIGRNEFAMQNQS